VHLAHEDGRDAERGAVVEQPEQHFVRQVPPTGPRDQREVHEHLLWPAARREAPALLAAPALPRAARGVSTARLLWAAARPGGRAAGALRLPGKVGPPVCGGPRILFVQEQPRAADSGSSSRIEDARGKERAERVSLLHNGRRGRSAQLMERPACGPAAGTCSGKSAGSRSNGQMLAAKRMTTDRISAMPNDALNSSMLSAPCNGGHHYFCAVWAAGTHASPKIAPHITPRLPRRASMFDRKDSRDKIKPEGISEPHAAAPARTLGCSAAAPSPWPGPR
jgi:hypothetical protein